MSVGQDEYAVQQPRILRLVLVHSKQGGQRQLAVHLAQARKNEALDWLCIGWFEEALAEGRDNFTAAEEDTIINPRHFLELLIFHLMLILTRK